MSEAGKGDDCLELESSMAESRLRAPDLGVSRCLGKCQKNSPGAGKHPFSGKSFYLDLPAGKNLQFLTGAIQQLGGVIEGFLSKEVSYIVSSRREVKAESSGKSHRGCPSPSPSEVRVETSAMVDPKGSHPRPSQKPVDSVPLSRGKELLQKAIRNQGTCPAAESRTRKVARLKAPFLKIEDESRKFRPFHHQFKSFPEISFLGPKDASPFEAPTTLGSMHHTRESKDGEPSPRSAARTMPRRKKGYCECCQEAFEELHVHLQSAQHRSFALEAHLYAEVDRIIAQLSHSFADIPFQAGLPRWSGSPASDCDPLCPETLHPHQPSHPRAASPRIRKEDSCQASGIPEQDGTVDITQAPAERAGTGEVPGPIASCQDLGVSVDVFVDPPGIPVSRSPACQCLLPSSGFMELSSGPDLALFGHKRKVQFPSGSAEKRVGASWPQASFFVPIAPNPCGTRTTSGKHLPSLPLTGHESRLLTSLQPLCHSQTCLSLPDPFPWQPTDRPAEFWATQPSWLGKGWPPGPEDSECTATGPVSQEAGQLPSCPTAPGWPSAPLYSATSVQPSGAPVESRSTSLLQPLPASAGASCSRCLWAPQPLQVPCLPVSQPWSQPQPQPQPHAGRELLL
ncbi:protein DBF4 homolog B isoform X11 [Gorilla gorilla gorilla]|uniref:protein DBF4 homolog B isoform X11 n=1 Tax=Gorilla gorilla gorilla TaxID=9595 RepID=UPI002445EDF9|nr:protein DBF4 homolog B isoform X8 [Gorilla gorilla gorilla]